MSVIFLEETKPKVEPDGTFSYASTVAFSEDIYLRAIPWSSFYFAEEGIEEILTHESIHLAIYALDLVNESMAFDRICPRLGDLDKLHVQPAAEDAHRIHLPASGPRAGRASTPRFPPTLALPSSPSDRLLAVLLRAH